MTERIEERERSKFYMRDASGNGNFSNIPEPDLNRLLDLRHHDPHSILGAHLTDGGAIVRTYRPDAEQVMLIVDNQQPREMHPRPEPGLFEITVPEKGPEIFRHRLEVHYPGDHRVTIRQPYSFPPTLGDLDLFLWAEQKHEQIWKKMGAHPVVVEGAAGTAFALWAPNAAGVSVVGDFNGWDGRLHRVIAIRGLTAGDGSSRNTRIWEVWRHRRTHSRDDLRLHVVAPICVRARKCRKDCTGWPIHQGLGAGRSAFLRRSADSATWPVWRLPPQRLQTAWPRVTGAQGLESLSGF